MKNIKLFVIFGSIFASFLFFHEKASAYSCSLGFSSPHGSAIQVGDRVTWTLSGDFTGGRSYWFGTKDGITDVSGMDTTLSNPFTWTTDPFLSNTTGSYARWVQVNDANNYFLCQTNTVFVSVTATSPSVSLSPAAISLSIQSGASVSTYPSGWVGFTVSPNQLINWTAQSGVGWLTVSPSGSAYSTGGANIYIGPQAANLAPGTYTGTVMFSPAAGSPSFTPQTVNVTLTVTVTATPTATLSVSPTSLNFTAQQGGSNPPAQVLSVTGSNVSWNISVASTPSGWLSTNLTGGTYVNNGSMYVYANQSGLSAGTYNGTVTISSPANPALNIPVTLTVTAAAPTPAVTEASINGPGYLATGVNTAYNFYAKSANTTDSYLIFKVNWGDGQVTQTTAINSPAGVTLPLAHQWSSQNAYTITFTASSPSNYSVYKTTTLNISVGSFAPTSGTLSFSQNSFSFHYVQGGSVPLPYSITFTNTSNVNIAYTLSVSNQLSVNNQPSWLNTGYATGILTASPGQVSGLGASVNPSGLSPGTYSTAIVITGNFVGSPLSIPVTLTVTAAASPTSIRITSPNSGQFQKGTGVIIQWVSSGIEKVWVELLCENYATGPYYNIPASNGSYTLVPTPNLPNQSQCRAVVADNNITNINNTTNGVNIDYSDGYISLVSAPTPTSVSFSLAANPPGREVQRGATVTSTISASSSTGYIGQIYLSLLNLPAGINGSFSQNPIVAGQLTILTLYVGTNVPLTSYAVTIRGASGGVNQDTSIGLTILGPTPTPTPTLTPTLTPIPTCYWWQTGCQPTPTPTPTPTLTPTPTPTPTPTTTPTLGPIDQSRIYSLSEIFDGDLIRGRGDIAVWIVKIVGEKRYKRWLFGPQIFNVYGHLGFNKVKNISKETLNKFDTSNLIRKYDDTKVYELTDFVPGRSATRRWIQTLEIFLQRGFDFDSVYIVNQGEFNLYTEGPPLPITKADETKSDLPLTANISEAMLRFLGIKN